MHSDRLETSLPGVLDVPRFWTLPWRVQHDFVRRHYSLMLRALEDYSVIAGLDREVAVEICLESTVALRAEIELTIRKHRDQITNDLHSCGFEETATMKI